MFRLTVGDGVGSGGRCNMDASPVPVTPAA
jgi:hypothetical protein